MPVEEEVIQNDKDDLDDRLFETVLKQAGRQGYVELGSYDIVWFVKRMGIDLSRSFELIFPFKDVVWAGPYGSFKIRLLDESNT